MLLVVRILGVLEEEGPAVVGVIAAVVVIEKGISVIEKEFPMESGVVVRDSLICHPEGDVVASGRDGNPKTRSLEGEGHPVS
jgi:hypothetical protein